MREDGFWTVVKVLPNHDFLTGLRGKGEKILLLMAAALLCNSLEA